jgi:DNA-binding CsgD family transcriptional regulator
MINLMRPEGQPKVTLTKRETEVLGLVAQGHTSQEAAELLFLSPRTVSYHLSQAYEKLGVSNRVQAFRLAMRLGLLPEAPTI